MVHGIAGLLLDDWTLCIQSQDLDGLEGLNILVDRHLPQEHWRRH
jgi:hypothetical protein